MSQRRLILGGITLLAGAVVAFVPVRHHVTLEADAANPTQRIQVQSRSLLGLVRPGWGVHVVGASTWGSASAGFFLAPAGRVNVQVVAWPGFRQSLSIEPRASSSSMSLREEGDREAFRAWFVAILEQQLEGPSPAWEPAQRDCAGLLRFAFREALSPHTPAWRERLAFTSGPAGLDPAPSFAAPWLVGFPTPEGPRPFAKGAFLRRLACANLGRDLSSARPGDLIFFARGGARSQPDHAMAFARPDADGMPMLLYHTGPEGTAATHQEGEVRRVRLDDLLHHPDPEFRPLPENPAFLGLYRWQVLATESLSPADPSASRS